jgi:hypothetical protein
MLGIKSNLSAELALDFEGASGFGLNRLLRGVFVKFHELWRGFDAVIRPVRNRHFLCADVPPAAGQLVVNRGRASLGHRCCLHRQLIATAENCQWYESTIFLTEP